MTDPIARPGTGDPAIEHATEEVVETWEQSAPGKDADATPEDFARMREGFGDLAADEGRKDGGTA
jgi:hypothetical protein